ncbi:S-layer homology domain-containing protein [Paenibacillus lemnae]|uniref:S-layer homology domain-containing protein n=1 Tax=Paenibacillus lemnae TaxID=1330551 RepID=A0A848M5V6_PAELE|nr:S-layer homology domain-containing protein [Paenibacillus lemnae]NMO95193.1 S-layer homology domain-containing protein [Paenibacillus lemnae]
MKLKKSIISLAAASLLLTGTSAFAFSDLPDGEQGDRVTSLQQQGIISGVSKDKFAPHVNLTAGQAVHLVVKALDLKTTGKAPEWTDQIPESAWYASSLRIAAENGLPVNSSWKQGSKMTREEFADLLYHGVEATGDYPTIKMYIEAKDQAKIDREYSGAIQFLLLTRIAELDSKGYFRPDEPITRLEAAVMVSKAADFIASHQPVNELEQEQGEAKIELSVEKVNDELNKVIVTRSELPAPGYGVRIDSIEFTADMKAVIFYSLTLPDPAAIYPADMKEAWAVTYVSSDYTPELHEK